jgi:hypothetical protein
MVEFGNAMGQSDNITVISSNDKPDHLGLGKQIVYSGVWAVDKLEHFIHALDYQNTCEIGPALVNTDKSIIYNLIDSIFANQLYNYTFFVHNLGKFDSFYILDSLTQKDTGRFKITGKWKSEDENKLLGFTIVDSESKQRIYMKDSVNFFNTSLKKVLQDYKCEVQKGVFPHGFVNQNTLNYIGRKSEYKYFQNEFSELKFSREDYNLIPNENWDCKEELLKYFRADVRGLLEVLKITSRFYFDKYSLNMTKYLTLPSLAIAVFFTNYHNSDHQIKMVKGIVEKDIRSAYKGGIVNNYNTQLVTNANYYDMNSQYPSAMLLDMPVGNPVFTTNKNLNDIFAFVYGLITPPVKEVLPNLIIETTVNGEIVFSPLPPPH